MADEIGQQEPEESGTEKGIKAYERHRHNPFLPGLHIQTRAKTVAISTGKQLELRDVETGEVLDDTAFIATRQRVDTEQFVKIFRSHLRAVFDLSPKAGKVFGYLLDALRVGDHHVLFSMEECKEHSGYASRDTITGGLAELLAKQFIARSASPGLYFINPGMFFNGDRVVMIRDVVRKGSAVDRRLQEHDPWAEVAGPSAGRDPMRQQLAAATRSAEDASAPTAEEVE